MLWILCIDRRAAQQALEAVPLPSHWESIDPAHGNDSLVRLDPAIPSHAAERAKVEANLKQTLPGAVVHNVYRVQQPTVYRRYETKKKELVAAGGKGDIVAYHGTRATHPKFIFGAASVGFNPRSGRSEPGVSTRRE
jgi:hypothetical protein